MALACENLLLWQQKISLFECCFMFLLKLSTKRSEPFLKLLKIFKQNLLNICGQHENNSMMFKD
ncbi:CLUMA_CG006843, isoform A [Clunio marinus]|uniref:CLUMA_CG006843, isoform A n=1 Tax=Clunio marinus TaxID=568069 RepID=A0A1J1I137_9DIPT|nr:CLUMA_CG006843, isoform A [Clunio marinus]